MGPGLGKKVVATDYRNLVAINGVCPYYTMYPLDFPLRVLSEHASENDWVLDPFCGRGTSNLAARILGLPSTGLDISPVAVALAKAKLPKVTAGQVVSTARYILASAGPARDIPDGEFWQWAFHSETLRELCRLRQVLIENVDTDARLVLRAILLGELHGPLTNRVQSYFSNQCPRTFAPKPGYSVRFWRSNDLRPKQVDALEIIKRRASRFLSQQPSAGIGQVRQADCRKATSLGATRRFTFVITSPPYYGMRSYVSDQWLRNWFLGGPPQVPYHEDGKGLVHSSPEEFVSDLATVWKNALRVCKPNARLVVRFGGIRDRKQEPMDLIKFSLRDGGWRVITARPAGTALDGRRQAAQFGNSGVAPYPEYDLYAVAA